MRRKFNGLLLILIVIITLSACKSRSVDVNTSEASSVSKDSTTSSTDMPSKTNDPVIENQSPAKEDFYGDWSVKKEIAYGPVGIYSNDDIKKILGKKLSYSEEKAIYDTDICEKPYYKKRTVGEADFETSNKTKFSSLGISDASIVEVTVYTDSDFKNIWDGANTFYIKDQNTLILFDGGVYFELDKVIH